MPRTLIEPTERSAVALALDAVPIVPWTPVIASEAELDDLFGPGDAERQRDAEHLHRAAAAAGVERIDYNALWTRSLRAGTNSQRLDRPSTWCFDALWRAACRQRHAEATEILLADAITNGAHDDHIAALVLAVERDWTAAHAAFADVTNAR